jgi:hypothetical protein
VSNGKLRRVLWRRRTVVCASAAGIAAAAVSALTTRKRFALAWLEIGTLAAVTAGCAARGPAAGPAISASVGGPVYNLPAAHAEAGHLLGLVRLPPGARLSVREPVGAGAALSSYAVNVPAVPHLVDRHEFFVAAGTPASVIGWMERHRPAGSSQDDSGAGSAGEQWTSFAFTSVHGFAAWPDLVINAVRARGGRVAVRVDAQVAPRPQLPGTGGGAGDVRVVELGTMLGSFGYELRCDPAGGTVPHPARICAAIMRDPALLYSFPGPGHSCPAGGPTVSIDGNWNGKPLHSRFSVCTGGQERQAGAWAGLLPSTTALGTVYIDRGIGLVSLGEREAAVADLLRGPQRAPGPCGRCTRSFGAGSSVSYGGGSAQRTGWTVSFARSRVTRIESNVQLTVAGVIAFRGLASLRRSLHGWRIRTCGATRALVHSSPAGRTLVVYRGAAFQGVIVTTARSGC